MIKNGKLFGKLNIIDILIILLVICAGIFVCMKLTGGTDANAVSSTQTVRITFYGEEISDWVIAQTKVGDSVWDLDCERNLGTVVDIQTGDSVSFATLDNGTTVLSPKPGYSALWLTVELEGTMSEHGAMVGSTIYGAGHSVVIYAGQGKYYLKAFSSEAVA